VGPTASLDAVKDRAFSPARNRTRNVVTIVTTSTGLTRLVAGSCCKDYGLPLFMFLRLFNVDVLADHVAIFKIPYIGLSFPGVF
jgi:hypothetical protein